MRLKKELVEQLRRDIQEYYHMEDRIDEVKAKMTFNDDAEEQMKKEKNKIFFTKHLFIIFVILFSAILIGGSVGITCLVNYQHYNSEKSLNDKSLSAFRDYMNVEMPSYYIASTSSYSLIEGKNSILNIFETKEDNNIIFLYQYYSMFDNDLKIEFENKNYNKIVNNENDKKNVIGVLNDTSFPINTGDVVIGNVYINNELNRKITLNF